MKHKLLFNIDWDANLFKDLKKYITDEYEISKSDKKNIGDVCLLKIKGDTSTVIFSNQFHRIPNKNRNKLTKYRVVWKLSKEGEEFLKELVIDQNIGGGY